MTGAKLAEKIILQNRTNDVYELVQSIGITLVYARWHPTTLGEFHRKTNTIYVNLNAPIEKERIIAHELGHYFLAENGVKLNRTEEEKQVEDFILHFF